MGRGSCPSDCEFLTPEEQPCPSSLDCERLVHAAGVGALRGGPRRPGGRALTCPGIGTAGARAHPEFAKKVETGSCGASLWMLCAGRCPLGSGFSQGGGGRNWANTCKWAGCSELWEGGPLYLGMSVYWELPGREGIGTICVIPTYGGGELWGWTAEGGGSGPWGGRSVEESMAHISGSPCGQVLVSRCFDPWISRGTCLCVKDGL